jgi:hypothetical protein
MSDVRTTAGQVMVKRPRAQKCEQLQEVTHRAARPEEVRV